MKTRYIVRDCNGYALSFTGSGRSIQGDDASADQFATAEEAKTAAKIAEETGADIEPVSA